MSYIVASANTWQMINTAAGRPNSGRSTSFCAVSLRLQPGWHRDLTVCLSAQHLHLTQTGQLLAYVSFFFIIINFS